VRDEISVITQDLLEDCSALTGAQR